MHSPVWLRCHPPRKTTDQVFKNVTVLKSIPSDQLIPAMQFMSSSLGVQCDFCHMEGSFDKDDKKPKQIARKMMQMMIIINQEKFRQPSRSNVLHLPPGITEAARHSSGQR